MQVQKNKGLINGVCVGESSIVCTPEQILSSVRDRSENIVRSIVILQKLPLYTCMSILFINQTELRMTKFLEFWPI